MTQCVNEILFSNVFENWFNKQTVKVRTQIDKRITNIRIYGHFGDIKSLGDNLYELRWKSGRRIYYTFSRKNLVLLLVGGNKNAQKSEIKQARALIRKSQGLQG